MLANEILFAQLKTSKFDLALTGPLMMCSFAMVKKLGIPAHIFVSSSLLVDMYATMMGFGSPPSFVPQFVSRFSDRMSFTESYDA